MNHARLRAALMAAAVACMSSPGPALACSSCYGQAEGPMINAARLGSLLLLGVVLCLQVAFAAFFLYLRRRAARLGRNASEAQLSGSAPGQHGEWRSA